MRADCAGAGRTFEPGSAQIVPLRRQLGMHCPSCGAFQKKRSLKCTECGAFRNKNSIARPSQSQSSQSAGTQQTAPAKTRQKRRAKPTPPLIEFPSVSKSSIPEWRKELGERVREVQERRAREATQEGETDLAAGEDGAKASPLLELLPQAEVPPMNPLVEAALRRIERAYASPQFSGNTAVATAVSYDERTEPEPELSPATDDRTVTTVSKAENQEHSSSPNSERIHNLAVVPTSAVNKTDTSELTRKPKRLIRGDNDPALDYLDSIPTAVRVENCERRSAPVFYRLLSSIVDLAIVCLFSSPLLALTALPNLEWHSPRVVGFAIGTLMVVGFLYLTISTALTGRTLGMRLFSLRVVDARTGLIPTGKQSAGRALVYMLSLASVGLALAYTFIDSDKHTAHDRFSRTAVIRV